VQARIIKAGDKPMNTDTASVRSSSRPFTLAAVSLGFGVVQLDVTIVNTAIASIGKSLGGTVTSLQWIVSIYTITFAALILTTGALGDRIGAKRMFMAGFALFTTASFACGAAPSIGFAVVARAIQGVGAAILVPNSLALLSHTFPDEKERARAVAIWAAGASMALTAGPLLGGALIAAFDWRSIFMVNIPIGLVGLYLTWRFAAESTTAQARPLDLPGQVAAMLALGFVAAATIEAGTRGWHDPLILAGFACAALAALAFVVIERRSPHPMIPFALYRNHVFSVTALSGLLLNTAFYGLIFVFSLYFQHIVGYSALKTGLAFAPMMAAVGAANLLATRATSRFGAPWTIAAGEVIVIAGCIGLLGMEKGTGYASLVAQLCAIGAGLGLLVPPLTSTLLGSVDKTYSGIAAGALNSMRQTGSVLGVALFGSLVGNTARFMSGTRTTLFICIGLCVLACVAILATKPSQ
jgi:DHA2 family methylenomycin A resistance protein-like MFS transporter